MNVLEQIEIAASDIIIHQFSPKIVFHDIKHIRRVVKAAKTIGEAEGLSKEELDMVQMVAWLAHLGFRDAENLKSAKEPEVFWKKCRTLAYDVIEEIFEKNDLPADLKPKILQTLTESWIDYQGERSLMAQVLHDAYSIDLASKKGIKHTKLLYQEIILIEALNISTKGWYERALEFLKSFQFLTDYGKTELQPLFHKTYEDLQKEAKTVKKQSDYALQRELNVSEAELKDLKKKLNASRGRDDRGIQTMFRTTSKNHYTLNEMVDRKSSIMISVNSIILSIIIGGLVNTRNIESIGTVIPIFIMLWTGFLSIIFAVLAIRPSVTHGRFTEEEIRDKKGNLLYFGNFHSMQFEDYEWGIMEMLSDQDYLYSTMIRDIYYLGKTLQKKYKLLRTSLNIFMFGVGLSFIAFVVYRFVPM